MLVLKVSVVRYHFYVPLNLHELYITDIDTEGSTYLFTQSTSYTFVSLIIIFLEWNKLLLQLQNTRKGKYDNGFFLL